MVSDSFATPWTVVHQVPLSMGYSGQEYWSGGAISYSRGSSQPRDRTHVSCLLHWQAGSLPLAQSVNLHQISLVQLLSRVQLFETPWTAAHQASLSIANSRSLLKFMSTGLVILFNHPILCRPLLILPSIFPSFSAFFNESVLHIRCQSIRVSASASVLPMNIQD